LNTSQTPSTAFSATHGATFCIPFHALLSNNQAFCLIGSALLESQSINPPNPHLEGHLVDAEAKSSA
jgi:hypothetical protein